VVASGLVRWLVPEGSVWRECWCVVCGFCGFVWFCALYVCGTLVFFQCLVVVFSIVLVRCTLGGGWLGGCGDVGTALSLPHTAYQHQRAAQYQLQLDSQFASFSFIIFYIIYDI